MNTFHQLLFTGKIGSQELKVHGSQELKVHENNDVMLHIVETTDHAVFKMLEFVHCFMLW